MAAAIKVRTTEVLSSKAQLSGASARPAETAGSGEPPDDHDGLVHDGPFALSTLDGTLHAVLVVLGAPIIASVACVSADAILAELGRTLGATSARAGSSVWHLAAALGVDVRIDARLAPGVVSLESPASQPEAAVDEPMRWSVVLPPTYALDPHATRVALARCLAIVLLVERNEEPRASVIDVLAMRLLPADDRNIAEANASSSRLEIPRLAHAEIAEALDAETSILGIIERDPDVAGRDVVGVHLMLEIARKRGSGLAVLALATACHALVSRIPGAVAAQQLLARAFGALSQAGTYPLPATAAAELATVAEDVLDRGALRPGIDTAPVDPVGIDPVGIDPAPARAALFIAAEVVLSIARDLAFGFYGGDLVRQAARVFDTNAVDREAAIDAVLGVLVSAANAAPNPNGAPPSADAFGMTLDELVGIAMGGDPSNSAWAAFCETDEGQSMTVEERKLVGSRTWSGGEPTVFTYHHELMALRACTAEEPVRPTAVAA